jgi:hypothetical protein
MIFILFFRLCFSAFGLVTDHIVQTRDHMHFTKRLTCINIKSTVSLFCQNVIKLVSIDLKINGYFVLSLKLILIFNFRLNLV